LSLNTQISSHEQSSQIAAASAVLTNVNSLQDGIDKESLQRLPVQRKLTIGSPNDPLEHEADAVADKVMRMPEPRFIQRKCADCEEEEMLQQKPLASSITPFIQAKGNDSETASDAISQRISSTRSSGSSMDSNTQNFMESRFGKDFSNVKIHTGDYAAQLSEELNAQAFTVGNDIYFNSGRYDTGSYSGKHLLAHELTHTVQQKLTKSSQIFTPFQYYDEVEIEERQVKSSLGNKRATIMNVVSRSPILLARQTTPANPTSFQISDNDMQNLQNVMRRLMNLLDEGTRATLIRNKTIAIGLVESADGEVFLVYTVSGNWTNPQLRTATDQLGLTRWEALPRAEGRGAVGAPGDAEQLMIGAAETNNFTLRGMAVSRTVCADCNLAVQFYENGPIRVVEVDVTEPINQGVSTGSGGGRSGTAPAEVEAPSTPAPQEVTVSSSIEVLTSEVRPDGSIVSRVQVRFGGGIAQVSSSSPSGSAIPESIQLRIIQNADGTFASAESLTGQPSALAEAIGRTIVSDAPGAAAGTTEGVAAGATEGVAAGAAGTAARAGSRVLPYLYSGLKWGGPAVFILVTGYQLITSTPQQRPRVAVKAAGGLLGGTLTAFLVCNAALDLETGGWGLFFCLLGAGGAGGYAGSEIAGGVYDEATRRELSAIEQALQNMDQQPQNVKTLFYTMLNSSGQYGIPITAEFIDQFIYTVPSNLASDELYLLAGRLQSVTAGDTLQSILVNLSRAISDLPRRRPIVLPPMLNVQDIIDLDPSLRFRMDTQGGGRLRLLPPLPVSPIGIPSTDPANTVPLFEIRFDLSPI
jgi:hypothetical protein